MSAEPYPYAGDVDPDAAYAALAAEEDAVLVDVRTTAEWSYVGLPDLTALGKRVVCVEWQRYPDGAVNGELFVAYIEQQVVPSLARGDVLIMDNLPVHKAAGVRKALEAAGIALLFLPTYSPDPNPIEMVFAKMKAVLRKAAIRTVDALWRALGKISQSLTREECFNYFRHCGYAQSA